MLMNRDKSALLVIDVQARLAPSIHLGDEVTHNCGWLVQVAQRVGVPVVVTEHFPEKLGGTVEPLRSLCGDAQVVRKECFSAQSDGCLATTAVDARRQVVVCGTEAHVCVQQTALELSWAGKQVFIVADACGSRDPANRDRAFERMRSHGIEVVTREMVAFEWLHRGGTELFRTVNRDFIR